MPIAVVEKGKAPGSHLLSGAVVNPRAFRKLFPGMLTEDMPFIAPVESEGVYYLRRKQLDPHPGPAAHVEPRQLGRVGRRDRPLARRARRGARRHDRSRDVRDAPARRRAAASSACARATRAAARTGRSSPNFEPGSDLRARVTILAEGTAGHLTGVALERFGLQSKPQVWALGVKEVWNVAKPLDRVIHTMGWPLRGGKKHREFGGSFIYPMGENRVTLGMVVGLDAADATLSVHDLLQQLKTHPKVERILEGGERIAWGAKTIPEGGFLPLPDKFHFPGGMIVGDGAGLVNVPALKGIHYAMTSGKLAAETAVAAVAPGQTSWSPGALSGYDAALKKSFVWSDLKRVRNVRPAFKHGFWSGGLRAGISIISIGHLPPGNAKLEADTDAPLAVGTRAAKYPAPDGKLTFDKLSSVYLSGNKTRDDAPSHIRIQHTVAPEVAEAWVHMCPAHVYELAGAAEGGLVTVEVTPSNCVQCGAITAKGGRLTPPEGGSGPEYSVM